MQSSMKLYTTYVKYIVYMMYLIGNQPTHSLRQRGDVAYAGSANRHPAWNP